MICKNQRKAYGEALVKVGKKYGNVVALEADLGKSTMSCLFQQQFPERYFEMGIAEQNMASTAAGLSLTGKVAFIHSFAVFASGRAYDQIRQSICIPKLNVKICGSSSGLSDYGDGATHQSVEDVAIMRAIPNMTVLVPVDAVQAAKMVEAAAEHQGPVYMRISRNDMPLLTHEEEKFGIGKIYVLREGEDAAIFTNGVMASRVMEAAEILDKKGISVNVLNVSTVKPLDAETVINIARKVKGVVAAEEHSVIGGLGSAISEVLSEYNLGPVKCIGIEDKFGVSSNGYDGLLELYGLTVQRIVGSVESILKS